jgi:hypothetical protein
MRILNKHSELFKTYQIKIYHRLIIGKKKENYSMRCEFRGLITFDRY